VQKLNLKSIEGFTMGQITQGSAFSTANSGLLEPSKNPKSTSNSMKLHCALSNLIRFQVDE
jgi:hypothetical protein